MTPRLSFELEILIFGDILGRKASAASVVRSQTFTRVQPRPRCPLKRLKRRSGSTRHVGAICASIVS
jgi:hypothetical protein